MRIIREGLPIISLVDGSKQEIVIADWKDAIKTAKVRISVEVPCSISLESYKDKGKESNANAVEIKYDFDSVRDKVTAQIEKQLHPVLASIMPEPAKGPFIAKGSGQEFYVERAFCNFKAH